MAIIKTKRLLIDHLTKADGGFILELLNTPGWLQFIGDRGIKNIQDAQKYIRDGPAKSYQQYDFGLYCVRLKETNIPIGICGLINREELEDVDIGFAFLPAYIGKGYAKEAALATLEDGMNKHGLNRIVAITNQDNENSIRLLERIGLSFEKLIIIPPGEKELMLFGINRGIKKGN